MKIVAALQLRNELEQGNLIRCLDNCKKWSDSIVIYDDCSTDGSHEVYLDYTDRDLIILGNKRNFDNELAIKNSLLQKALTLNPDWIGNLDGDEVFDNRLTYHMKDFLEETMSQDSEHDLIRMHEVNLWKDECWYRRGSFNKVYKSPLWHNNGKLHYNLFKGLHLRQYPRGTRKTIQVGNKIIHYGFSTRDKIIRKYFLYKEFGQTGQLLDRLLDEYTNYWLEKVNKKYYPVELIPPHWDLSTEPPPAESYDNVKKFNTYEDYKRFFNE